MRTLVLILGDQLNLDNPALADFDPAQDGILMVEAPVEATLVWNHKARIALFLAAMRHHAELLRARGWSVSYLATDQHPHASLYEAWQAEIERLQPQRVSICEPGEWRLLQQVQQLKTWAGGRNCRVVVQEDSHFLISATEFQAWAGQRPQLLMENFYRHMRRRLNVLMDGAEPCGGQWNFDQENRGAFGRHGPDAIPASPRFAPDALTQSVLALVAERYADHPGSLEHFNWPVTRPQALEALALFIRERLPEFGKYQDAMWTDEPFLYHSLLSPALNLKLLDPREVIAAAETAGRTGKAPLAAVEGFIRQILGWREFIRGVYWRDMPGMAMANHFDHHQPLPSWFWTGKTHMACQRAVVQQTLAHGYAHHIQRLMITGNFALLAGLSPQAVSEWYLAVYVDAVEWVELPNVAGMVLYANGGRFTSKPYVASGAYVKRMSNYCRDCRYRPDVRSGDKACPLTTFYWDFLNRHQASLGGNPRTALMIKNLQRMAAAELEAVTQHAEVLRSTLDSL